MKFFSFILKMLVVLIGLQSYAVATPSMNETCVPDSYHVQPSSNNKISKKLSAIKTKIVDYAKLSGNTLKNIFSYKNQCIMAGILVSLYLLPMVQWSMVDSKPLHQIPAIIPSICKAMNYKFIPSAIKISTKLGFNACAGSDGVITLGQKLLDNMPSNELGFIIGHEIAHIQKNHHSKGAYFKFLLIEGDILSNLCEIIEEQYNLKQYPLYKKIKSMAQIISMPLFYTIAALLLDAKMSRYFEKQADLVAATVLNNAADGATAFTIAKKYSENVPLPLLRRIKDYIPLFRSHPTLEERISYLSALAIQQQAQSISA